ncbi:uncharacterized protein LOC141614280 [Silene latifolia]|uniref:uncharacterized protein LOC141614280 n=1 Tax=Silene latifolia TaxID=37657 RepID=UPI003D7759DA
MSIDCSNVEQFPPLISGNTKSKSPESVTNNVESSSEVSYVPMVVAGGPSYEDTQKTKSVNSIVGVQPYDLDSIRPDDQDSVVLRRRKGKNQLEVIEKEPDALLRFSSEDVKEEIEYWTNSVYCFILSANPPVEVVDARALLFDNKPLIVRPWSSDVDLVKEDVKDVPVWVRLEQLPLKFWGKCLPRIAGLLGKFIQCDVATKDKTRLGFARVMVEVPFGKAIPDKIKLLDEDGHVVVINVVSEWKPLLCTSCKGVRYATANYRKMKQPQAPKTKAPKEVVKKWRPKARKPSEPVVSLPSPKESSLVTPIEKPNQFQVTWGKNGKYHVAQTSAKRIIRFSRQELLDKGYSSIKFGKDTVLESLNTATPTVGIGVVSLNGSALPPSGGNPLMFSVNCLDYSAQSIHMEVKDLSTGFMFNCTMVYAFNDLHDRKALWSKLCAYNEEINGPWVICGDFNTVLVPSERLGVGQETEVLKWPLKQLNMDNIDDIVNNTARAQMNLEFIQLKLRADPSNAALIVQEMEAHSSVRFLESACSEFLLQKSKAIWVDKGDDNTKYFHSVIKGRQLRNKVIKIEDTQGVQCDDPQQIQEAFLSFYTNLLGTSEKVLNISHRVVKMGKVCSAGHKQLLLSLVTNEEIKKAMFSIPSHKVAGPYGYSSAFFKDAWDVVGDSICLAIKDFFQTDKLLKQLNHTLISLIPKCAMPQNVTQFHPISCCNVVYRCISKLLCNRLSGVLPELISDSQGGFIKGRSIVENILICQDIVRLYNRKSVSSRFLMKVDMKKAYDSVSWEFLEEIKGDVGSIMVLLRAFATFSRASGLHLSPPKTNAYFNRVTVGVKEDILLATGVQEGHLPFKYLGVHITTGRLTKAQGQILVEKITARIASFGSRRLSYSGRLVLVNSVLTSLYTYWMSIFVIPKGVLHRLNSIYRNYLWDGSVDHLRVPPVSWAKICSPKKEGGLGLRDSFVWNVAVMGKLVWWIFFNPDKLWVKWISGIYLKGRTWTAYVPSGDVSWGWRTTCRVRDKLSSGYSQGQWLLGIKGYTMQSGYEMLRVKYQAVDWHSIVWNKWAVPKHKFICWLIAREALQVKAKLFGLGIATDEDCLLCGCAAETHIHLFQQCPYSRVILLEMASVCHVALPSTDILRWIWLQKWSIIEGRNRSRVEHCLVRPEVVFRMARNVAKMRIGAFQNQLEIHDRQWLESIDVCK